MPSFTINPKLSQGNSHSGARLNRGTPPQARSAGVTPNPNAEASIKDWSGIINNTPKSQVIEIVKKAIPESCEEGEKPSVTYLREKLISVLNKNPNSETAVAIQQQITQAAHVLEHESQMTKKSMLKIVGIMDEGAPGKLENEKKADIFKWINNEFGQLAVGKKNAVLSTRNNILAQIYAEKAPNDAGTSKKMPTLKDIYGVDDKYIVDGEYFLDEFENIVLDENARSEIQAWRKGLLEDLNKAQLLYVCRRMIDTSFSKNETATKMKEILCEHVDKYRYEDTFDQNDRIEAKIAQARGLLNENDFLTDDDMMELVKFMSPKLGTALKGSERAVIVEECNAEFKKLTPRSVLMFQTRKLNLLMTRQQERESMQAEAPKMKAVKKAVPKMTTLKKAAPSAQVANSKTTTKFDPTISRLISESKESIGDLLKRICAMEELLR